MLHMPRFIFILVLGIALASLPVLWSLGSGNNSNTVAGSMSRLLRRAYSSISGTQSILQRQHPTISPFQQPFAINMSRTPVYFVSHGGPTIMEDYDHPAYKKLQEIGREITQKVKPKAVVVFSAHWRAERDMVEVNTATSMGLIYDFYGFPAHFYEHKYPNTGSPELAQHILETFEKNGIKAEGVRRGLDHGVFAPFTVAFNPEKNPLNVPLVQVSLFDSEDPDQHYALGRALSSLRDENIVIIGSGMAVHNLRDMWRAFQQPDPMPYSITFDQALKEAVEQPVEERQKAMSELLKRNDARRAHPTFEHLLPVHIAAGAAGEDVGKQTWTLPEGSLSWGQFRFGEVPAAGA
jgi:4,5-DOPA dioxygenase extradiol